MQGIIPRQTVKFSKLSMLKACGVLIFFKQAQVFGFITELFLKT